MKTFSKRTKHDHEVVQGFGRLGNRLTDMWGHGRGFQMGRAQKQR